MTEPQTASDPLYRNWLWRSAQLLAQNIFVFAFRYRVKGLDRLPPGGALWLLNHQSFIDPLVAGVALRRPISYLARHNLFDVPFVGWVLRNTYVIPIRRDSAATESIRLACERLKQGYYVGIFPEGTRSRDGRLQELKPGFLAIARRANVPIVPVGIAGAGRVLPRGAMFIRPRTVRVVIGDVIDVDQVRELSQRGRENEFLEEIRSRLEAAMNEAANWVEVD